MFRNYRLLLNVFAALVCVGVLGCKHMDDAAMSTRGRLQTWGMPGETAFLVELKSGTLRAEKSGLGGKVRRKIVLEPPKNDELIQLFKAAAEDDLSLLPAGIMDGTGVRVEWVENGISKSKRGRVFSLGASAALKKLADELNRLLPEELKIW